MAGISGKFGREVFFLLELGTQCDSALRAYERMHSGVLAFNDFSAEHDKDAVGSRPIEILRSAHSFLTHVGIAYRLLYSPSFKEGQEFARQLRALLEIDRVPKMSHAYRKLRHRFEHVDEQMHDFLDGFEKGGELRHYEGIRVLPQAPAPGRRFLRWVALDPLRITFGRDTMRVDSIKEEVEFVRRQISHAYGKLRVASEAHLADPS